MAGFVRPGSTSKDKAFGISLASDRDGRSEPVPVYNRDERLSLQQQRARLPVYKHRAAFLYLVEHHATVVIVGETGSGKTTQLPQYLLESGWCAESRMVACTQPRRVAAVTVAGRVAEEAGVPLGGQVGYAIRFEDVSTPGRTQLKFCTDGVLLREMMEDPLLSAYSVVMVDEAHERSLATDTLLGLLKKVQRRRPDLRIVVASATLQAEQVAAFFRTSTVRGGGGESAPGPSRDPAILTVAGRTHPVQVHYLAEPCPDYVRGAVQAAADLHAEDMPGDILVFLTGQEEVEAARQLLEEEAQRARRGGGGLRLAPVPLYAGLPSAAQLAAFEPAPRGYRKVVIATNIAETSVTLEGVVYVVDCCFAKQAVYDPFSGLEALLVGPISQASAKQRAGRAGRVRPGHCLRLCTEAAFKAELRPATVPEMQRGDLAGLVLQLKALGIDNLMGFDYLSPPPAEALIRALELLCALGALDADARLTRPQGLRLAELPVDPRLGRILLAAAGMGCAVEAATIVSVLAVQSVWVGGRGQRKALQAAQAQFAVAEGDLITYLNVWRAWEASLRSGKWAGAHYLNHRNLLRAADIRQQLCHHLRRFGLPLDSCGSDVEPVRKAFTAGLFMNAVQLRETDYSRAAASGVATPIYRLVRSTGPGPPPRLRVHANSVLARTTPPWLLFFQAQLTDQGFYDMQEVLAIEPEWLAELAPHVYQFKGRPKQGP